MNRIANCLLLSLLVSLAAATLAEPLPDKLEVADYQDYEGANDAQISPVAAGTVVRYWSGLSLLRRELIYR